MLPQAIACDGFGEARCIVVGDAQQMEGRLDRLAAQGELSGLVHRGQGSHPAALDGARREIARLGGGTVESYPRSAEDRSVSGSFLHNATVSMVERHGFERTRPLGKHH